MPAGSGRFFLLFIIAGFSTEGGSSRSPFPNTAACSSRPAQNPRRGSASCPSFLGSWNRAAGKGGRITSRSAGFPDLGDAQTGLFGRVRISEAAVLPLSPGFKLWEKIDYSVRKNVRRARSSGLALSQLETPEDIRDVFYPLHLRSLKRLGSPPHPLGYFLSLQRNLGEHLRLSAAWLGRKPIAALLGWAVGDSVQITDIASDERFFRHRATDLLHYELIDGAAAKGCRLFDFGPVRYAGQRQYKMKWGVEIHDHCYYYVPAERGRPPLSDQTPAARAVRSIWRLFPTAVTARVGRLLRRELAI